MSAAPLDPVQVPSIPRGVLSAVADLVGPATAISPRQRWGSAVQPTIAEQAQMKAYGLVWLDRERMTVTPTFASILEIVLDPDSIVDLNAWIGDSTISLSGALRGDHGLAVNDAGDNVVISGPLAPTTIGTVLAPVVGELQADVAPGVELDVHLPQADALALAAVIEVTRTAIPLGVPVTGFPVDALVDHGAAHWSELRADDLRLLTPVIARWGEASTTEAIETGLERIDSTGLVMVDHDRRTVTPSDAIVALAGLLPPRTSGWRWERTSRHGDQFSRHDHVVLAGLSGAALFIGPGAEGHIGIRTVSAADVVAILSAELAVLHHPERQA